MTTATLAPTVSGTYTLDPSHSRLGFVARHAMVTKVRGSFDDFAGSITLDTENPAASTAEVTMQVASVDTRNAQRDEHLRTNDFFDVPNYPTITFTSTGVSQTGSTTFDVVGDLTIKGVTKSVTVAFEFTGTATDPYGNDRVGFEGQTTINRTDFGVNFNAKLDTGGVLVGEKITIELEISAIKVTASA